MVVQCRASILGCMGCSFDCCMRMSLVFGAGVWSNQHVTYLNKFEGFWDDYGAMGNPAQFHVMIFHDHPKLQSATCKTGVLHEAKDQRYWGRRSWWFDNFLVNSQCCVCRIWMYLVAAGFDIVEGGILGSAVQLRFTTQQTRHLISLSYDPAMCIVLPKSRFAGKRSNALSYGDASWYPGMWACAQQVSSTMPPSQLTRLGPGRSLRPVANLSEAFSRVGSWVMNLTVSNTW